MKGYFKRLSWLLTLMLLLSVVVPFNLSLAEEQDITTLTIVHTNDTHGRVEEDKYAGMGFAKIATKVKEIRESSDNVLVIDAGDTFHGQIIAQLTEGESIVKIMNAIGYDAMVPGNHDFNYGQEKLKQLAELANFPIVSANIIKEDDTKLLEPYTIKELDGIKIGIFGLSTPETTYKTHPKNVEGLTFENPVEVAQQMVDELKDEVDIIIALSHLGLDESSEFTSEKVATEVEGIDLIVDGHSHTELPEGKQVGDTLIVQAGEYDVNLGIVELKYGDGEIVEMTAKLFTKDEATEISEDEEMLSVIAEIKEENEEITSVVVANTDIRLEGEREKVRAGETNLGNLIAEAMLKVTEADIALTNGGGIRASIEPGEITRGDIITVLPFGSYVVVKEVKGSDILAALEHGISAYPETLGAFPHVAGVAFTFDPEKEPGNRLVEVKVNGEPLDPDKTYKLATNDFLAAGGDEYVMFTDYEIVGEFAGLDEILAEHIKVYGIVDAKVDGRIQVYTTEPVPEPASEPATETYIVNPGDVLWKIAEKFGLTWEVLADFNNMENPHLIFPGQEILVPVQ